MLSGEESFRRPRYTCKSKRTQTKGMEWSQSQPPLPHREGNAWRYQALSVVVEGVCSTCRFAQSAALVFKMDVSCITTQQTVYKPVDIPSSVSISGLKSVSCWLCRAYASRVKHSAQGREICEYTYPAGKLWILECCAPELFQDGASAVPGWLGVGSGVGCLHWSGEGASVPLHLKRVYAFFPVQFWQPRHLVVWFWQSIPGCLSIAAFTHVRPGNSSPCFFYTGTSVRGFMNRDWVSSIVACENTPVAILDISNARCKSDCSSWTRPPCHAIVADMLKTYKKWISASNNEIRLLPQPSTHL